MSTFFVFGRWMYQEIPEELRAVVEPVITAHGLELVDVETTGVAGTRVVRVTVDTPAGDGAVSVERCAAISRELGTHLDASDAVAGAYRLEVSSPGLDRHLAREKDFSAALGREVRVETRRPLDGRRRFRGRLVAFEAGVARVRVDGQDFAIPFAEVAKAKAVYEFSRADYARGRQGQPGRAS
jgi:ribosome maturation factor RimP